MGLDWNFVCF